VKQGKLEDTVNMAAIRYKNLKKEIFHKFFNNLDKYNQEGVKELKLERD